MPEDIIVAYRNSVNPKSSKHSNREILTKLTIPKYIMTHKSINKKQKYIKTEVSLIMC